MKFYFPFIQLHQSFEAEISVLWFSKNLAISSEVCMTWEVKVNKACFLLVKYSDVSISRPHLSV